MPAIRSPLRPAIRAPLRSPLAPALGGSQSLTAQVQALFAGGRIGGMWDFGDTATLFQDYATPVTADTQPIGMVLDKSRGLALGAEAVPSTNWNGGYTTNGAKQIPTGWIEYNSANVASATVSPNSYQFTATAHLAGIELSSPAATVIGRFNKCTIRARKTAFVSGTPSLQLYTGAWQEIVPSGAAIGDWHTKTIYVLATQTVIISSFSGSASWEVEYLTVKELPGNHATQPTAGSRPLFSAIKNLLTKSEQLEDGGIWKRRANVVVTANQGTGAFTDLDRIENPVSSGVYQGLYNATTVAAAGGTFTAQVTLAAVSGATTAVISLQPFGGGDAGSSTVVSLTTTPTVFTHSHTFGAGAIGVCYLDIAPNVVGVPILAGRAQIERNSVATRYQRVNTASDYDTVGFPAFAQFDATDDALLFPAITFGGAFNTFVAGKTTSGTRGIPLWRTADAGNGYWAVYENLIWPPNEAGVGTPSYAVNGVALSPVTRGELYSRINGVDSVVETTGIVLTAETALQFSGYGGFQFQGNAHRILMISGTLTAAEKLLCRQWAAQGNGVTVV